MSVQQSIQKPFGVTAFGSSIVRVEPDITSLQFTVSRLEQRPKDAFRQTREAAKIVATYLTQAQLNDVGSSRIALNQSFKYSGGEQQFIGYTAKITFHVLLRELDRIEEVLIGVTEAGANEINAVAYQTSRVKEIRIEARQRAISAAREKAEIYCGAAGVTLGPVIHIEDINPDILQGREGHVLRETQPDDEGPIKAFNPSSISVGGAVVVAFELGRT